MGKKLLDKRDVVFISYPRVGRTWYLWMTQCYYNYISGNTKRGFDKKYWKIPGHPGFGKTHEDSFSSDPLMSLEERIEYWNVREGIKKLVFCIRDPRNVMVSLSHRDYGGKEGIGKVIKKRYNRFMKYCSQWDEIINKNLLPDKDIKINYYEEFIKDTKSQYTDLLKWMGIKVINENLVKKVLRNTSLKKMKEKGDKFNKPRKGKETDFRKHMTDKEIKKCTEMMANIRILEKYT